MGLARPVREWVQRETNPVDKPPSLLLFGTCFYVLLAFTYDDVFKTERALKVATDFSGININLVSVSFLDF